MTTLALIGKGHWGTIYINTVKSLKGISIPDKYIFGRDYKENLTKKELKKIGGIIVASPSETHFEVASYLLKQGFKSLLIEKPLTQKLSDAIKLQKLVKEKKAKCMVGHVQLYDPAYQTMRRIARKKIGKINKIKYFGLKSPEVKGSTVLKDWGPHPIYIFLDLTGEKPTKIKATPTKYDNIRLTLKFQSGITGVANIGTLYPRRRREIEIIGERGKLKLNEFLNPRNLVFVDKTNNKTIIKFPTKNSPLANEVIEFAELIKVNKKTRSPISQGVEVVKVIRQAERSI